ncbi:MAG: glucose-1-phosphate thymidylyltransferase [Chitinophagaceae bacterium]|nr:glucose-1-phosphate thymidylyltransferase [Chitinophagaceae bacterium]
MTILLDDITVSKDLYPFGQVNSIAHIRIGMMTILERWQLFFKQVLLKSEKPPHHSKTITFPANIVPSHDMLKALAAGNRRNEEIFVTLNNAADIFKFNDWVLRQDFEMLTENRESQPIPAHVQAKTPENIFIEENADIEFCYINAEAGPVYISEGATIMQGSMLRGPLFIGKNSLIKMGAKIYGATTIGPACLAGGEIKNSVIMGFSNKAHDGYLGDSVIGEWCNLGAGTSNSNLKNNAGEITLNIPTFSEPIKAGMKCGLLMGDYSRSAINTSFNTGTVTGISCNIYGAPPEKYIPNFSWGTEKYELEKALRDIDNWKKLKGFDITPFEKEKIQKLYNES